jgi:hypothetical protein
MTTPHNPDDKLFRVIASRPELVKEMLEKWAPPLVLARLDLRALQLSDSSFVDEALAEHFADIVYTCQTLSGGMVPIPLILEHKSYVPANPPLQVMRYQMLAWAKQETTKGAMLTPVLPVIFYHGVEKWEVKPWGDYLHGMDPAFEPYTPSGGYIFIDLSGISDDDIKAFRSGFLITTMLLMKHRLEREFLLKNRECFLNCVTQRRYARNVLIINALRS